MITYNFEEKKSDTWAQDLELIRAAGRRAEALRERLDAKIAKQSKVTSIDSGLIPKRSELYKQLFPTQHTVPVEELQELFKLVQPYLLRLYRDELKIPGCLSFGGGYWISRIQTLKYCLRTGAIWSLKECKILTGSTPLMPWLLIKNQYFNQGVKNLREWAIAQQNIPVLPEPFFHESNEMVQRIFYAVMFNTKMKVHKKQFHWYRNTARNIWKIFSEIYGPENTRRTPDFSSSYRMLKFLRWSEENDPQDFSVTSTHHAASETFEIRDNWYCPNLEMKTKLFGKTPLMLGIPSDEELYNRAMEECLRITEVKMPVPITGIDAPRDPQMKAIAALGKE
jgi:hypothetical protein